MRFVVKKTKTGICLRLRPPMTGLDRKVPEWRQTSGKGISLFDEVLGDDTEDGVTRNKEALRFLEEVVSEVAARLRRKSKQDSGRKRQ